MRSDHEDCRDRETDLWWALNQIWQIVHAGEDARFAVPNTHDVVRAVRQLKARQAIGGDQDDPELS